MTTKENAALQLAVSVLEAAGRNDQAKILRDLAWRLLYGKES
jgi:ribosomal protein L18E